MPPDPNGRGVRFESQNNIKILYSPLESYDEAELAREQEREQAQREQAQLEETIAKAVEVLNIMEIEPVIDVNEVETVIQIEPVAEVEEVKEVETMAQVVTIAEVEPLEEDVLDKHTVAQRFMNNFIEVDNSNDERTHIPAVRQARQLLKGLEESENKKDKEDAIVAAMEALIPMLERQNHLEQQQAFKVLNVAIKKYAELESSIEFRLAGSFYKQGGAIKSWKERWFVAGQMSIMYFKDRKSFELGPGKKGWNTKGSIDYADITDVTACGSETCKDTNVKSNRPKKTAGSFCIHLHTAQRTYPLLGFSKDEAEIWLSTLSECLNRFRLRKKTVEWLRTNPGLQELGPRSWGSMRFISKDQLLNSLDLIQPREAEKMLEDMMNSYESIGAVKKYVLKDLFLSAVEKKGKWLNAKEFYSVVLTEDEYFHRDLIEQLEAMIARKKSQKTRESMTDDNEND